MYIREDTLKSFLLMYMFIHATLVQVGTDLMLTAKRASKHVKHTKLY